MAFPGILGHERALLRLREALNSDRLHHAYLLAGPEGVGKEKVALAFAKSLVCDTEERSSRPCGSCAACRKVEHGAHPDVILAMPQAEAVSRGLLSSSELDAAPSRELRVNDVRELERRVRLPPYEARHKVVILTPADKMNQSAQNALLKTLEEPPRATTLLLVTAAADMLLPTVRSRCARISFGPLPVDLVARELVRRNGGDQENAEVLAVLSGGSLGRALDLDGDAGEARRKLILDLRGLDPSDGGALVSFAEGFSGNRQAAENRLEVMSLWYRDVLAAASGASPSVMMNPDLAREIDADARRIPAEELVRRLEAIAGARRDIAGNVNARLVMEGLVAGFEGAG